MSKTHLSLFINRFLHGGPVEGFDRLIVQNEPERELPKEDLNPDRDFKTDFRSVVWALLLKEARNLPSDEKLGFYLKTNPEAAELVGFDGPDDTPEKTTFWRAHSSEEPRISVEAMDTLKTEARKIVHHAKYVGFELPEKAEEHLLELGKDDLMDDAEAITQRLLKRTLPHIAFDRDESRTTYSLPSIIGFLAHLSLEDAYPENGSETFDRMDTYDSGGTGADNFYYWVKQRDAEDGLTTSYARTRYCSTKPARWDTFRTPAKSVSTPPVSRGMAIRVTTSSMERNLPAITPTNFISPRSASWATKLR
jgi:hypothetical protein